MRKRAVGALCWDVGMDCLRRLLVKFVGEMDVTVYTLLRIWGLRRHGKSPEVVAVEEPWSFYKYVAEAAGQHNARLILITFVKWLKSHGVNVSSDEVEEALSSRDAWFRLNSRVEPNCPA